MILLASHAIVTATLPPDIRTAIATESLARATDRLVTVTAWLVLVTALTLIAAAAAAWSTFQTYQLEARPGLIVTSLRVDDGIFQFSNKLFILVRESPFTAKAEYEKRPALLRGYRVGDELLFSGNVMPKVAVTLEVRNVSRAPIVDGVLTFALDVAESDEPFDRTTFERGTHSVRYTSDVHIAAIAPNSAISIPIMNGLAAGLTISLLSASQGKPDTRVGARKRTKLPWIAESVVLQPV